MKFSEMLYGDEGEKMQTCCSLDINAVDNNNLFASEYLLTALLDKYNIDFNHFSGNKRKTHF